MNKRLNTRLNHFQWKPRKLSHVIVAALFVTPGVANADNNFLNPENKWGPTVELMGQTGSTTTGRGKLVLPIYQDQDSMVFTDLRARDTSEEGSEYNAGLAYRKIMRDHCLIWGVYGFYDYLQSELNNHFDQITVGTEMLSMKWDARANVYIPLEKRRADDHLDLYEPIGHNIFANRGFEEAMYGADAEAGYHMGIGLPTVYLGGFYFANSDVETMAGPRAHADLKLGDAWRRYKHNDQNNVLDHVDMSLIGQYDDVRGWQGWVEARLNFDLQGMKHPRLEGLDGLMKERIIRDNAVVTQTFHGPDELLLNKDGNPYYIVYADNVHGNDNNPGTIEQPVATVQQAVADATGATGPSGNNLAALYEAPGHSGDFVYLWSNGGNPYPTSSEIPLAMNQTIHGGGADFIFHDFPRGDDFTLIRASQSSVIEPDINGFDGEALIALSDNNTVRGLTLEGDTNGQPDALTPNCFSYITGIEVADYDDSNFNDFILTSANINNNVFTDLRRGADLRIHSDYQNVNINISNNDFNSIEDEGVRIKATNEGPDSEGPATFNLNMDNNSFEDVAANQFVPLNDWQEDKLEHRNPDVPVADLFAVNLKLKEYNGANIDISNNNFLEVGGGIKSVIEESDGVLNTNIYNNTMTNFGNADVNVYADDDILNVLGAQGILLQFKEDGGIIGTTINNNISGNVLHEGRGNGIEINIGDDNYAATFTNNISNNNVSDLTPISTFGETENPFAPTALPDAIRVTMGENAILKFWHTGGEDGAYSVNTSITGNTISDIAGNGIDVISDEAPLVNIVPNTLDFNLNISGNTIDQTVASGINFTFKDAGWTYPDTSTTVNFDINNNKISHAGESSDPVSATEHWGDTEINSADGIAVTLKGPRDDEEAAQITGQIDGNTINDVPQGDGIRVTADKESLALDVNGNTVNNVNGLSLSQLEFFDVTCDDFQQCLGQANGSGISVLTEEMVGNNTFNILNNNIADTSYFGILTGMHDVDLPWVPGFNTLTFNISGNTVNNTGDAGAALILENIDANTNVTMNNNTVSNVETGLFDLGVGPAPGGEGVMYFGSNVGFASGGNDTTNNIMIDGNTVKNVDEAGIFVFSGIDSLNPFGQIQQSINVSNNNVTDSDTFGIFTSVSSAGDNPQPITITNNTVKDVQLFGLVIFGQSGASENDVNATITGNTILPGQGVNNDLAILTSEDVSINGNDATTDNDSAIITNLESTNTLSGVIDH